MARAAIFLRAKQEPRGTAANAFNGGRDKHRNVDTNTVARSGRALKPTGLRLQKFLGRRNERILHEISDMGSTKTRIMGPQDVARYKSALDRIQVLRTHIHHVLDLEEYLQLALEPRFTFSVDP